uniref:Secreted protein n=1 Tax=Globodera rostochiensis TaxID=31243 RepID=A0A914H2D5_GLORO
MAYQINNIVLICIIYISAIFGITINSELNCWMGFSMGGPPFGDDDEFGPLFDMNCSGENVNCMSTNCVLDEKTGIKCSTAQCQNVWDALKICAMPKMTQKSLFLTNWWSARRLEFCSFLARCFAVF